MAPKFCSLCGKKPTKNRILDPTTATCTDCSKNDPEATTGAAAAAPDPDAEAPDINDDTALSDIRFGDLKTWLRGELRSSIKQIVKEEMKTELVSVRKSISDVKTLADENKQSTAANSTRLDAISENIKTMEQGHNEVVSMSKNNLKYLVNLDRNERRQNIIIFGVPETDLVVDNVTADSDIKKCQALFRVMNVEEECRAAIKDVFRLGNITEDDAGKRRPLKVKFLSSKPVSEILKASKKLKEIQGENIYVKPDKTKGEQEEFKRIGERKTALLAEYNDDAERVKLTKGVLYVDGVEVDRYKSVQTLF